MLDKLKKTNSIKELIDLVKKIYVDYSNNDYFPAIIEQGTFSSKSGEDFYLKLVMCHQNTSFDNTWIMSNLSLNVISPDADYKSNIFDYLIYNVIVFRKVKGQSLYQLNPNITDYRINEYEYDNNEIVNMYFNDEYAAQKGKPVLKIENRNNILVLKNVFENYLNDPNSSTFPKYKLVAEIEYRTFYNRYDNDKTGKYLIDNDFVDYYVDEKSMRVLATINLGVLDLKSKINSIRKVKVLTLGSNEYRDNNSHNFNDDVDAGLIIFDIKVLDILKKDYYIYDLYMYDKTNVENRFIVDILDDIVVFWEGEYNKLPSVLKDKIDQFNIEISNPIKIISEGMFAWQLDADWNFQNKMYPEQKLASIIKSKYFRSAVDIGISFHIPSNLYEFKGFIEKLEFLTKIRLESFGIYNSEVNMLIAIRDDNESYIEKENILLLFRKYCYQIGKRLNDELFKRY